MNLRPLIVIGAAAAAVAMAPVASASASSATSAPSYHLHGFHLVTNSHMPRTVLPHLAKNATVDSQNWSGYAAVAKPSVALRYAQTTFTVPNVNCATVPIGTEGQTIAAEWVGLDGFNSQTVEQTGIESFCDSSTGPATVDAWYEMFPKDPVVFSGTVSAGDTIFVAVYYNSSTKKYQLTLKDETTGASMQTNQACPSGSACDRNSAEVIEEDPGGSVAGGINLADFGTASFNTSHVTARDGLRGTLSASKLWTSSKIIMQDPSGEDMATPSSLTNSGANFTIAFNQGT